MPLANAPVNQGLEAAARVHGAPTASDSRWPSGRASRQCVRVPQSDQQGPPSQIRFLRWHRSPGRVAVVVAFVVLLMWNSGRRVFVDDAGSHPGWNWIVLFFIGYAAFGLAVGVPRLIAPRARRSGQDEQLVGFQLASIRLAIGVAPFLTGFASLGAGAEQWVFSLALVATLVCLAEYVRATKG